MRFGTFLEQPRHLHKEKRMVHIGKASIEVFELSLHSANLEVWSPDGGTRWCFGTRSLGSKRIVRTP